MDLVDNWLEEKRSAYLYHVIAKIEKNPEHKKLFQELATMAEKQADIWAGELAKVKRKPPAFKPGYRTLFLARLIRIFGTKYLRVLLAATKIRGMSIYRNQSMGAMHSHSTNNEHKHLSLKSGSNIRAAVFGINDGLVSNACLILGVAGAHSGTTFYNFIWYRPACWRVLAQWVPANTFRCARNVKCWNTNSPWKSMNWLLIRKKKRQN